MAFDERTASREALEVQSVCARAGAAEAKKGIADSTMIKVKANGIESVSQMIRRFKKMCEKEGLTKDIKRNSYYEKPSERRRRRMRKSMKRTPQGV